MTTLGMHRRPFEGLHLAMFRSVYLQSRQECQLKWCITKVCFCVLKYTIAASKQLFPLTLYTLCFNLVALLLVYSSITRENIRYN